MEKWLCPCQWKSVRLICQWICLIVLSWTLLLTLTSKRIANGSFKHGNIRSFSHWPLSMPVQANEIFTRFRKANNRNSLHGILFFRLFVHVCVHKCVCVCAVATNWHLFSMPKYLSIESLVAFAWYLLIWHLCDFALSPSLPLSFCPFAFLLKGESIDY